MKRQEGNLNMYYYVKESDLKGFILYASNYMALWKRQNYVDSKKSVTVKEWELGER